MFISTLSSIRSMFFIVLFTSLFITSGNRACYVACLDFASDCYESNTYREEQHTDEFAYHNRICKLQSDYCLKSCNR